MSVFTQFSQQYYQPIIQVAASWGSLQLAFTGRDRIQEMFDAEYPQNAPASYGIVRRGVEIITLISLMCRHTIFKDVSISAPKGQMIAVVYPTHQGNDHHEPHHRSTMWTQAALL